MANVHLGSTSLDCVAPEPRDMGAFGSVRRRGRHVSFVLADLYVFINSKCFTVFIVSMNT